MRILRPIPFRFRKNISTKFKILICIVFVCALALYFVISRPDVWALELYHKHFSPPTRFQIFTKEQMEEMDRFFNTSSKLLINTTGCAITRTPIIPAFHKDNWHGEIIPVCDYEIQLSDLSEDGILTLKPEYDNYRCFLHEITRVEKKDNSYTMSPGEEFTTKKPLDVSQKEILLTKCGNSLNFEANFVIRPSVQEKLNHWTKIPKEDRPPSVILLGIDTMSRSHAFRSLPKTMALMKEMGFSDFKGYHSADAGTLHNFFGFLMGLLSAQVRSETGCSPDWTNTFDKCPIIWKDFDLQNYITMYVEDGAQTFNFGGQSGFRDRPTDFYIHPLFKAIKQLRAKYSPTWGNPDLIDCTSNETVPEFVVRYTKRFNQKFHDVPTFSFTWFGDPFHENQYTLAQLDTELLRIYKNFNSTSDSLENTVLIFLSDHGDRYSRFIGSTEAYLERSLPPLMIRIPKSLRTKFPNLDEILATNTESLIGPIDVHHTLKHILSMTSKTAGNFEPVLPDRSSLFYPVSSNRTCEQIHVERCACGVSMDSNPVVNPFYLEKILEFAQLKLNQQVSESKYAALCVKWTSGRVMISRILKTTDDYSDNLIQFVVSPGNAKFEVTIRVLHSDTKFDGCELIGEFERISAYGTQSNCVNTDTDYDKKMKGLCMCKK